VNKKELEERLARLGPGPVSPELAPQVLYLRKKVTILTNYLLSQKSPSLLPQTRQSSGRFAPRQNDAEEAS